LARSSRATICAIHIAAWVSNALILQPPEFAPLSETVELSMKRTWLFAVLLLPFARVLLAQGFTTSDAADRVHLDFVSKPCLQTEGITRSLASNSKVFNHIVSLDNHCNEQIKVRICYHRTDSCTVLDVPGGSRREQIIGVFPAMQTFQYDVREQF
jgi:hypothetical protein